MSGQAIYESFASSDMRVLADGAQGTARIHKNYEGRTEGLARLINAMERAWQGEAAGVARRGAGPLAVSHMMATPEISNAATSMQQQVEAFETAKNSVVPVPPMPEKPGFFENMLSFGNASEHYEQQVSAIQSANDRNVAVMAQYEAATRQNQAMLSEIPKTLNPSGAGDWAGLFPQPASPNPEPYAILQSGSGGQSGRSGQSRGGPTTTSGPPPAQPSAPPDSPTANTGLGQTHAESAQPSPRPSLLDSGSPKPTTPAPLPEGPKPGLPLGPVGGYRPGADPGRGGAPGGPRGYGAGNLGEPGGRGGIGARGPAVAEGAAGRAAAAGRAGGPGSGVPLGAGARNQEQQDLEHRRPAFLVESDPDEIFGSDEAAAPPVIGA